MIHTTNNLRFYRERANVAQQDISTLLNIPPSNLTRYENGLRNTTPEIILTYHILFGATLQELFQPLVKKVKLNLIHRSMKLMERLSNDPSPKSDKRITYLQEFVKLLNQELEDEYTY